MPPALNHPLQYFLLPRVLVLDAPVTVAEYQSTPKAGGLNLTCASLVNLLGANGGLFLPPHGDSRGSSRLGAEAPSLPFLAVLAGSGAHGPKCLHVASLCGVGSLAAWWLMRGRAPPEREPVDHSVLPLRLSPRGTSETFDAHAIQRRYAPALMESPRFQKSIWDQK